MARALDGKPRSDRRQRHYRLTKRVTVAELRDFQIRAAEAGFANHQDYLTALVVGDIALKKAQRKDAITALGHLGKIGNNINQLAKAANQGRISHLDERAGASLERAIKKIEHHARAIREALK